MASPLMKLVGGLAKAAAHAAAGGMAASKSPQKGCGSCPDKKRTVRKRRRRRS